MRSAAATLQPSRRRSAEPLRRFRQRLGRSHRRRLRRRGQGHRGGGARGRTASAAPRLGRRRRHAGQLGAVRPCAVLRGRPATPRGGPSGPRPEARHGRRARAFRRGGSLSRLPRRPARGACPADSRRARRGAPPRPRAGLRAAARGPPTSAPPRRAHQANAQARGPHRRRPSRRGGAAKFVRCGFPADPGDRAIPRSVSSVSARPRRPGRRRRARAAPPRRTPARRKPAVGPDGRGFPRVLVASGPPTAARSRPAAPAARQTRRGTAQHRASATPRSLAAGAAMPTVRSKYSSVRSRPTRWRLRSPDRALVVPPPHVAAAARRHRNARGGVDSIVGRIRSGGGTRIGELARFGSRRPRPRRRRRRRPPPRACSRANRKRLTRNAPPDAPPQSARA